MHDAFADMTTLRRGARALACAVAVLSGFAGAAQAQGTADERRACTPDVFRLCSSEIPNVERIVACLNRDQSRLSPACRAVMAGDARASGKTRAARTDR